MEHRKLKEADRATASPQPALVNQAPAGLDPSGFDQAQTLDEIEAIRAASYAVIATGYYAGQRDMQGIVAAAHAREDIDRAADKARDRIVQRVLSQRRIAA